MQKSLNVKIAFNAQTGKLEIVNQKLSSLKNESTAAKRGMNGLKGSFDSFIPSMKSLIAGAAAGFGVERAIRAIVTTGADFERTMLSVKAKSGATKDEFDALSTKAKELGSSTEFSSKQVAKGMDYLSMAGFNTEQILSSITGVMDLSTVGMTDLGVASDIASNILSGFSMKSEETARVVDVMAKATTSANTNIPELGNAMKYVAPIANGLGISLEEATAAVMSLSNAGIKSEQAGTTMRTMLNSLAAPTNTAIDTLKSLDISVSDFSNKDGELKPLADIVGILNTKMKGLSQTAKADALKDIFGTEAMSGAVVLLKEGKSGLENYTTSLQNADGAAKEMAQTMRSGVGASMNSVSSAAEGVLLSLFDLVKEDLKGWLDSAASSLQSMKTWIDANQSAIANMTNAIKAVAAGFAIWKVSTWLGSLSLMRGGFNAMGASALGAVTKVKLLNGAMNLLKANPIGLALTAATTAYTYFSSSSDEATKKTDNLTESLTTQNTALTTSTSGLERLLEAKKKIVENEKMDATQKEKLIAVMKKSIEKVKERQVLLESGKGIATSSTNHAIKEEKRRADAVKKANASMYATQKKEEEKLLERLKKLHGDYFKSKIEKLNDWTLAQVKEINETIKNEKQRNEALATLGDIAYKKYSDLEEKKTNKTEQETAKQEKIYSASVDAIAQKYGLGFTTIGTKFSALNTAIQTKAEALPITLDNKAIKGIENVFGTGFANVSNSFGTNGSGLTHEINEKTFGLASTLTSSKGGLTKITGDFLDRFDRIVDSFDGSTESILNSVKQLGRDMLKNSLKMMFKNSWDGDIGEAGFVEKMLGINIPFLTFNQGTIWGNGRYGVVNGNSPFSGDDIRNDTIPALISPGEAVIPRSAVAANYDLVSMLISGARMGNFANGYAPAGIGSNVKDSQMNDGVFNLGLGGFLKKTFKKVISHFEKIVKKIGKFLWKIANPLMKTLMKNPELGYLGQIALGILNPALIPIMLTADLASAGMTLATGGNLKDALGGAGLSGLVAGASGAVSSLIQTGSVPTSDLTAWETIKKFPNDIIDNLHGNFVDTKEAFSKLTNVADLNGEFGTNMSQLSFENMKKGFLKVGEYTSSWSTEKFTALTSFFKNPSQFFQYIFDNLGSITKKIVMSMTNISKGGLGSSLDVMGAATPLNMAPQVHAFAEGGVVRKPTFGWIGETGDSEAVVPLSRWNEVTQDKKMHAHMEMMERKFDAAGRLLFAILSYERKNYAASAELVRLKRIELKAGGLI